MLRAHLASGAYDRLTDPPAFASAVTADLQSVAKDGHLRLALQSSFARRAPAPADAPLSTRASGPPGLEEARMIGDVAYLRFNEFPEEPGTAQAARRFLISHADAKAVIIDSRPNRGGGLGVMDAILPLLYAKKTHLLRMDTRASADAEGPLKGWPTLVRQSSPPSVVSRDHLVTPDRTETRLQRTPVYYLTSGRTASAAEHLALAFKRTHRAILIGETTRGADHFGGLVPIGERFAAFVPVGRTYNPQTGWDWEGRGVAPDIAAPADDALAVALKQAKAAAARPPGR
jgi:C-terminal processing protease CtpA/Prc